MWVAFAVQKLLTFFQQKISAICVSLDLNFNKSLTNDIVSFEQLGPVLIRSIWKKNKKKNTHTINVYLQYEIYSSQYTPDLFSPHPQRHEWNVQL